MRFAFRITEHERFPDLHAFKPDMQGQAVWITELCLELDGLQGIPREDILLEEESTITRENLDNAIAIMEKAGFHSAIIVSDPLHMKRAMLMVEEQTMTFHSSPTPTTMYRSLKTQLPFLVREVVLYTGYQLYYFLLR